MLEGSAIPAVELFAERVVELSCRADTGVAQTLFKMEKLRAVKATHTASRSVDTMHHRQASPVDSCGKASYRYVGITPLQRGV